jgi:hypothetical protein
MVSVGQARLYLDGARTYHMPPLGSLTFALGFHFSFFPPCKPARLPGRSLRIEEGVAMSSRSLSSWIGSWVSGSVCSVLCVVVRSMGCTLGI